MEKANQRIKSLQHDLANLKTTAAQLKDEDDSDDDEIDDGEAIKASFCHSRLRDSSPPKNDSRSEGRIFQEKEAKSNESRK